MQHLVDGLAHVLNRSVAVDDRDLRLIVHSTHFGDADPARLRSLTDRGVDDEVRDYLLAEGIRALSAPALIPARPQIGVLHARRCFPLRHLHELFGYMWVTEDTPLSSEELEQAESAAERLAALLAGEARARSIREQSLEPMVRRLLDPNESRSAIADLSRAGVLADATSFDVYAVRVGTAGSAPDRGLAAEILRKAFAQVSVNRPPHSWAFTTDPASPALILGYRGGFAVEQRRAVATQLVREIERSDSSSLERHDTIGVGSVVSSLQEVPAAYRQARSAARIAATAGERVVLWEERPLEALLDAVVVEKYPAELIPPVLADLDLTTDTESADFLRTYLDAAGNVARVSELLGLHRTTVYYRLQRFAKDTGLDLERGADRLLLHLWLHVRAQSTRSAGFS